MPSTHGLKLNATRLITLDRMKFFLLLMFFHEAEQLLRELNKNTTRSARSPSLETRDVYGRCVTRPTLFGEFSRCEEKFSTVFLSKALARREKALTDIFCDLCLSTNHLTER